MQLKLLSEANEATSYPRKTDAHIYMHDREIKHRNLKENNEQAEIQLYQSINYIVGKTNQLTYKALQS